MTITTQTVFPGDLRAASLRMRGAALGYLALREQWRDEPWNRDLLIGDLIGAADMLAQTIDDFLEAKEFRL